MKTYSTKSNARRAAKTLIDRYPYLIGYDVLASDKRFFAVVTSSRKESEISEELFKLAVVNYENSEEEVADASATEILGTEEELAESAELSNAEEEQVEEEDIKRVSEIERPCARVWDIIEKMRKENPAVRRSAVIQACVDAGIAYNTARTQYQIWYTLQPKN